MGLNYNEQLTEILGVADWLAPASQSVAAHNTTGFSMALVHRVIYVINVGAIAGGATVDFKLQSSATSGGTYNDIAGTPITQITATPAGPVTVELKAETLSSNAIGPWVRGVLTIGTAVAIVDVVALKGGTRYLPAVNTVTPAQQVVA